MHQATTENISWSTPHEQVMELTRIQAITLARDVLPIYGTVYPDAQGALALALDDAEAYAKGSRSVDSLWAIYKNTETTYMSAVQDYEQCAVDEANRYYAAADVAEAVLGALAPVVDLCGVRTSVESARRWGSTS